VVTAMKLSGLTKFGMAIGLMVVVLGISTAEAEDWWWLFIAAVGLATTAWLGSLLYEHPRIGMSKYRGRQGALLDLLRSTWAEVRGRKGSK
jgi:hypothetical protein